MSAAEQTLQQREAFGRDILNSLSAHIAVLDRDGIILAVNDSWLDFAARNQGSKQCVGVGANYFAVCRTACQQSGDTLADAALVGIQRVLSGELPSFTLEYPCHAPAASRWFLMHARPLSGPLPGVVVAHEDITDRRRLEEELRQAHKLEALGTLASGVAHDFNNLITVVQGNTAQALADEALSPSVRDALLEVAATSHRATTLTRQLLTFTRRQSVRPELFDLNEAVADISGMLRRLVSEDIEFCRNHHLSPLWVNADRGMFDQILLNLVVNARDAMPHGGQLSLHTAPREVDTPPPDGLRRRPPQPGSYACLGVTDTGEGILPEHLPHIFDPFFTTKSNGRGTGIGLATVHTIVEQHQGWIEVDSTPGKGSTFRILLPLANPTHPAKSPAPTKRAAPQGNGQNILLVEDNAPLANLTATVLRRHGYRVLTAATGPAAVNLWKLHAADIHLLLTDIVLPGGLGGLDLARTLHADQPCLPVLFCSGYGHSQSDDDSPPLAPGACMLEKPFLPEDLLLAVAHCLHKAAPESS